MQRLNIICGNNNHIIINKMIQKYSEIENISHYFTTIYYKYKINKCKYIELDDFIDENYCNFLLILGDEIYKSKTLNKLVSLLSKSSKYILLIDVKILPVYLNSSIYYEISDITIYLNKDNLYYNYCRLIELLTNDLYEGKICLKYYNDEIRYMNEMYPNLVANKRNLCFKYF
uniref:Uncharacterized protein n=1 Tax=viral metagenome TaxID=1070528 RepID=A0A6C0H629_9ZZZZ